MAVIYVGIISLVHRSCVRFCQCRGSMDTYPQMVVLVLDLYSNAENKVQSRMN